MIAEAARTVSIGVNNVWTVYAKAGAMVAAVTATDAFSTTAAPPVHVNHWDGARWSPINVSSDDFYFTVAASASDFAVFGSVRVSNPTPVWQSFIRVP